MIVFDYKITKLLKDEFGIVKVVFGTVTATDDFNNVVSKDIQSPLSEADQDNLIPFDQLDEATVIQWFKAIHEQSLHPLLLLELDYMRLQAVEGVELPWSA